MSAQPSIRDFLYEPPGPRARRRITAATVVSAAAVAAGLALVVRQFAVTGQLDARYWSFFARATTWRFLGQGLAGTVKAALAAGALTFCMGLLLMLGRISRFRPLQAVSRVLIEFSRGVPTLLFIYFFFLAAPQLELKLPAFWKIALPVAISAAGVVAEVLVKAGQQVSAGDVLMTVYQPEAFQIRMSVPEDMLSGVRVGDEALIYFNWNEDKSAPCAGVVREISYVSEETAGGEPAYSVYVDFRADETVRLGMNVTVVLP